MFERGGEDWRGGLSDLVSGGIFLDEPLAGHTSLKVGGKADVFISPGNIEELGRIIAYLGGRKIPFIPLGNGTNILIKDKGYRGAVISLAGLRGIRRQDAAADVFLQAGAGVSLGDLVGFSLEAGLEGMEFCAGIPGSIGGAAMMNAGAYGREMKDCVRAIGVIGADGQVSTLSRDGLIFRYRGLELPPGSIIGEVTLVLKRGQKDQIKSKIEAILAKRRERHPLDYPSAGSIFKNPPGRAAGRIIEDLGLKGRRMGEAQVSHRHGNFIVNLGGAKASDILGLIELIKDAAWVRLGIRLETEVRIAGED